jgi:hypothetical protein
MCEFDFTLMSDEIRNSGARWILVIQKLEFKVFRKCNLNSDNMYESKRPDEIQYFFLFRRWKINKNVNLNSVVVLLYRSI